MSSARVSFSYPVRLSDLHLRLLQAERKSLPQTNHSYRQNSNNHLQISLPPRPVSLRTTKLTHHEKLDIPRLVYTCWPFICSFDNLPVIQIPQNSELLQSFSRQQCNSDICPLTYSRFVTYTYFTTIHLFSNPVDLKRRKSGLPTSATSRQKGDSGFALVISSDLLHRTQRRRNEGGAFDGLYRLWLCRTQSNHLLFGGPPDDSGGSTRYSCRPVEPP